MMSQRLSPLEKGRFTLIDSLVFPSKIAAQFRENKTIAKSKFQISIKNTTQFFCSLVTVKYNRKKKAGCCEDFFSR